MNKYGCLEGTMLIQVMNSAQFLLGSRTSSALSFWPGIQYQAWSSSCSVELKSSQRTVGCLSNNFSWWLGTVVLRVPSWVKYSCLFFPRSRGNAFCCYKSWHVGRSFQLTSCWLSVSSHHCIFSNSVWSTSSGGQWTFWDLAGSLRKNSHLAKEFV